MDALTERPGGSFSGTSNPTLDLNEFPSEHHLVIAGTGRAGTTFLVRYLTALGLDTHISRHGDSVDFDEQANAGLEDIPAAAEADGLPYVVKSPWLYEFVEELTASKSIRLDAVIIPMRDLVETSVSRTVLERRAIHEHMPWMAAVEKTWENWCLTPGGTIFSLNPIDQGRLLAVGFYRLVEQLVKCEIPIVFLAFPRFAQDWEYLYGKLRLYLPRSVTQEAAQAAHQKIVDLRKVRVGAELASARGRGCQAEASPRPIVEYPDPDTLDLLSIRRELGRLRGQIDALQASRSWKITRPLRLIGRIARRFW